MDFKRTYEELNMLLPYSSDIKVQQSQREQMAVMSFLAELPSEFETAKNQILSSSKISSLQNMYSMVLRTEGTPLTPLVQFSGALVSRNNGFESGRSYYKDGNKEEGSNNTGLETRAQGLGGIICHYCHNPGHLKYDC